MGICTLEVLIFMEGGKPENLEKNPQSKDKNEQQTQPVFQPENFTWGPKWPLKTYFRGQFFRKGASR